MASSWLSAVVYVLTCGLVQWGDQEEERDAAAPLLAAPSPSRWARCVPLAGCTACFARLLLVLPAACHAPSSPTWYKQLPSAELLGAPMHGRRYEQLAQARERRRGRQRPPDTRHVLAHGYRSIQQDYALGDVLGQGVCAGGCRHSTRP